VAKPLKSVTHGQCDARPTVTFPAVWHHRPVTGTNLYCLVTEAHECEQLAQGCYLTAERLGVEPRPFESRVQRHKTITPPGHRHTHMEIPSRYLTSVVFPRIIFLQSPGAHYRDYSGQLNRIHSNDSEQL